MSAEKIIERKEKMEINNSKIGKIEFEVEDIIKMTSPMLGFPKLDEFLLISTEQTYPFFWFQSIQSPDTSFLMIETVLFFKDYKPKFSKKELNNLKADEVDDLKIFAIVVVPSNPKETTANLRAPIVINEKKNLAKQIILDDDKYSIKTKIFNS